jgi:hypothetical protein
MRRILLFIVTTLVVLSAVGVGFFIRSKNAADDAKAYCQYLLFQPGVTKGYGAVILVDDLVKCQAVMEGNFSRLLDNLVQGYKDAPFVVVYRDHPFYVVYDSVIMNSARQVNWVETVWFLKHKHIFYTLPGLSGLLTDVNKLMLMNCGDTVPKVEKGTLVIYPCTIK